MVDKSDLKTAGQRIRHVRILLQLSQKKMAKEMDISQSTLSQIENDHYAPTIESLFKLQQNHNLNCNWLISGEGHVFLTEETVTKKEIQADLFEKEVSVKDKKAHDQKTYNANDIPLVDSNAVAGYLKNHGSPEYLATLETYQIPGFETAENHRIFQVNGESMVPTFQSGDFLICEFIDHPENIDTGTLVVVISEEGVFTKRIYGKEDLTYYVFKSDNANFEPFLIKAVDIMEIWKVAGRITSKLYPVIMVDQQKITQLENDMDTLKKQLQQLLKGQ